MAGITTATEFTAAHIGRCVAGHGVASGRAADSPYPAGTISLQAPLFARHEPKPVHFWREDARRNAIGRKTVTSR